MRIYDHIYFLMPIPYPLERNITDSIRYRLITGNNEKYFKSADNMTHEFKEKCRFTRRPGKE